MGKAAGGEVREREKIIIGADQGDEAEKVSIQASKLNWTLEGEESGGAGLGWMPKRGVRGARM